MSAPKKSGGQRTAAKRGSDLKARRKAAGLRRVEVWVPDRPEFVRAVQALAERFRDTAPAA